MNGYVAVHNINNDAYNNAYCKVHAMFQGDISGRKFFAKGMQIYSLSPKRILRKINNLKEFLIKPF
jgi:hypothetical protein